MTTTDDAPNTKHVTVPMPVPRDPAAYAPTTHFKQRRKYRSDPTLKDWIIRELLERGHCSGEAHPSDHGEDCFRFERTIWSEGEHDWRLVVAINPEAFRRADATHTILSGYCPCHDDELEDCR